MDQIHTLDLNATLTTPLFSNQKIKSTPFPSLAFLWKSLESLGRIWIIDIKSFTSGKLDLAYAQEIIQKLVVQGNAEWEGKEKTRCLIIWRTPDEWADLIYKWVKKKTKKKPPAHLSLIVLASLIPLPCSGV